MGARKANFRVIPEGQPPYLVLSEAMVFHDDLHGCKVAMAWKTRNKPDVDGNLVLGKCVKVTDLQKEFAHYDFIIVLNRESWEMFSEAQRLALVDHELSHAAPVIDEKTGEPVYDERERKCWRNRRHDIEEFTGIVARHGLYKLDLERFYDAMRSKAANPLFEKRPRVPVELNINMDKSCSRCGDKGTTERGLCLKCITDDIPHSVKSKKKPESREAVQ